MRMWRTRRLALLGSLCLLAACTSISYEFGDLAPVGPHFRDRKPQDWKRPPWGYPVHGTDVAKYQGHVDWARLKADGIRFAFIKATEGGDRIDSSFAQNWEETREEGIPRGAYHFFYFCTPAIDQAAWFIRNVPKDSHALPPVADVEWNPASPTCTYRPPAQVVRQQMKIFLEALAQHYNKEPIVYTTVDFFRDNDLSELKGYSFWLRSVASHPKNKFAGHPWLFWQYTGTGILPGIKGDADINAFNGDKTAWLNWLKANTD